MARFPIRGSTRIITAAALAAVLSIATGRVYASGEVRLVKASSVLIKDSTKVYDGTAVDSTSLQKTFFLILIKNIAYAKQVSLLIKNDSGWDTLPCDWARQADDENEYWTRTKDFTLREGLTDPPRDLVFKILYVEGIHIYWDDNHGKNFHLAKDGGTLLNGENILVKSAKWEADTSNPGATVFSGEVEVHNQSKTNALRVSYTTDYMKTQDVKLVTDTPVPTWTGAAAPADSDRVYVYRFSFGNIKMPSDLSPRIQFNASYLTDNGTYSDTNLSHSYSLELGWSLDNLSEDLLLLPVGLRLPKNPGLERKLQKGNLRIAPSPLFDSGAKGFIDGMGRTR